MGFSIIGTGSALPDFLLTNEMLQTMVDTSDEWITTRTGIKNRHICTDESLSSLAASAAKKALQNAGLSPADVDLIICTTIQGDYISPSLACLVQRDIGATCPAFDINAACTGFIYALDIADRYFEKDNINNILIVSAEAMSRYVDWTDRASCVLFGDGAGAVLLSRGDDLLAIKLTATGDDSLITIPRKKGGFPGAEQPVREQYFKMNGQEVYKFAVKSMCDGIEHVMKAAGISEDQVTYVIPHQANIRIIEAAKSKLNISGDKFISDIHLYGNTSSSSIPIVMDQLNKENKLHKSDVLVAAAFGGGLTSGAAVLRWSNK